MRTHMKTFAAWLAAFTAMALACGGTIEPQDGRRGDSSRADSWSRHRKPYYTVGGTISGLSGTVVLQDNGTDDLSQSTDGPFTFATALKNQSTYAVTVRTQPSSQTCVVADGSGTIAGANVTNVTVSCSPNCSSSRYTVGGTITGLSGTIVLQDNGDDDLGLAGDGSFTFSTTLADCSGYSVTVLTQPSGQTCTVASGTGTIAGADVSDVAVTCSPPPSYTTYTVGGAVTGLSGTVVLQDNGGDDLTLNADGSFAFATPLANSSTYDVSVRTQPSGQTCGVANGSGTISGANVTNVEVSCQASSSTGPYTVGGSLTGLSSGNTLVLYDNGTDALALSADASFTFPTPLATGSIYDVTLEVQPTNQLCTITNKTGTVAGANVTDVLVSCEGASTFYFNQGYCSVDPSSGKLTGECMGLDTCSLGVSPFCTGSTVNFPVVQAYCGPLLDYTICLF